MTEWTQLANTTGVAIAVLAAVGFASWRVLTFIGLKAFGDDSRNPPVRGFVNAWLDNQREFHVSLQTHSEHQMTLCDRHATSLETISSLLSTHDSYAKIRTDGIAKLVDMHINPAIPHSTAQAIHNVEQLKLAAMTACNGCREACTGMEHPVAEVVVRKCNEIEQILKSTVTDRV